MRRIVPIVANRMSALAMAVIIACTSVGFAQEPAPQKLNIEIIDGEDAINNIRLRTAREPIVEVTDENRKPVAGALVLFTLPRNGAGGSFSGGSQTLSVTTNAQGRAVATGLQPNNTAGRFNIQVDASKGNLNAQTTIHMRNVRPFFISTKWLIIGGVAVAVAITVAIIATRGGSTTVITPGSPSVGGR